MDLNRKQIGRLLKLPEEHVVIDRAVYDPVYTNDLKIHKLSAKTILIFQTISRAIKFIRIMPS